MSLYGIPDGKIKDYFIHLPQKYDIMKLPTAISAIISALAGIAAMHGQPAAECGTGPAGTCREISGNGPHYADVGLSVNFLREAPDYTAELGTQALMGDIVEIVDRNGYWCKVVTEEPYTAWCTDLGLVPMEASELEEYRATPKYICTAWKSTVYSCPSMKSQKICDIVEGDILRQSVKVRTVRKDIDGKAPVTAMEIQRYRRPVTRKGFAEVLLPDGRKGYVPGKDILDYGKWEARCLPTAENITAEAMKFIGVPYLWGGASPNGVDCSGLVRHVFMMNGIELPRNASQQASSGKAVEMRIDTALTAGIVRSSSGRAGAVGSLTCGSQDTSRNGEGNGGRDGIQTLKQEMLRRIAHLRPGDLLFFGTPGTDVHNERITHVGIYMGDGKMIHSSQVVRINSLVPGEPDYYENSWRLVRARRILD